MLTLQAKFVPWFSHPVTIPEKTHIAQLAHFQSRVPRTAQGSCGDGSVGSGDCHNFSGLWTFLVTTDDVCLDSTRCQPTSDPRLRGLLETGANVTIISFHAWPPMWPLVPIGLAIEGLGGKAQTVCVGQKHRGTNSYSLTLCHWSSNHPLREGCFGSMGGTDWDAFLMGAAVLKGAQYPTLPFWWVVSRPIWENQWPLTKEKLVALRELVQKQLQQGHIEPSTSPWNTPGFVIKKKNQGNGGCYKTSKNINAVMESIGALQPGMPSFTPLPMGWKILIIDLKDCFFHYSFAF